MNSIMMQGFNNHWMPFWVSHDADTLYDEYVSREAVVSRLPAASRLNDAKVLAHQLVVPAT